MEVKCFKAWSRNEHVLAKKRALGVDKYRCSRVGCCSYYVNGTSIRINIWPPERKEAIFRSIDGCERFLFAAKEVCAFLFVKTLFDFFQCFVESIDIFTRSSLRDSGSSILRLPGGF